MKMFPLFFLFFCFFSISHGKNVCYSIGGTIKNIEVKTSLQRLCSKRIITFNKLFNRSKSNIQNINLVNVTEVEYASVEKLIEDFF